MGFPDRRMLSYRGLRLVHRHDRPGRFSSSWRGHCGAPPASQIAKATAPWTLLGLAVVLLSGPVLFLSDPRMYLYNPSFRFKIGALVLAIIFNYTIHRKVAMSDSSSRAVAGGGRRCFSCFVGQRRIRRAVYRIRVRKLGRPMVILEFFQWVQSTDLMTFIRESGLTYPLIMSTHLACIAVFGGMIVITDLRLLGAALRDRPIADVVNGLRWWKRLGFCIMVAMGIMLAGSKAAEYYPNPYFWVKMSFLGAGLDPRADLSAAAFITIPRTLDASPVIPTRAKVAGALSLILWTSVVCNGRLIGYYEPPSKRATWCLPPASNHARLHLPRLAVSTCFELPHAMNVSLAL